MKLLARRFNIYLALAVLLGPVCGCQTGKPEKEVGALRVHIEMSPDPPAPASKFPCCAPIPCSSPSNANRF